MNDFFQIQLAEKPEMIEYLNKYEPETSSLEQTLNELNSNNIFFRIESTWDSGFDVLLLDPAVHPNCVETDVINCRLLEANKGKHQSINFLERPENDVEYSLTDVRDIRLIDEYLIRMNGVIQKFRELKE